MNVTKTTKTVTTDADGAAEVEAGPFTGKLVNVIYTKPTSGGYADGVDFDLVTETGIDVWDEDDVNASKAIAPQQPLHSNAGVALVYASGGEAVTCPIYLANEKITITIANGGATKTGQFDFIVVGPTG
ncbi:MAG: hypothetical protein PHQ10_06925, partial [Dehalococcoidales bacterium]|nr:hypothetical protein [Dehalococcoidales bacterium]